MKITLANTGKRYNAEWIFRGMNIEFCSGNAYAVLGANGSGKSTLLQVIAGNILSSEGNVKYEVKGQRSNNVEEYEEVAAEKIFSLLSFAAPYLELPEEMTLQELVEFHFQFKRPLRQLALEGIIEALELKHAKQKQVKYFSSGMKQRVKLGLAILSDTPLLLLDEPAGNLDQKGIEWYRSLIAAYGAKKLIVVCSNRQKKEYDFCGKEIVMEKFKNKDQQF